mmetsp:Transcript_30626/g.50579  ORF Transcript_30626/g.50579 Transcript_30626/m.50579 type:complete len:203 (+) Transcript_30626:254-862(+)|eukprot:CAMPEP_0119012420 /NCGR_PEP_ID=MMETSP1176-20130426/6717_1 /TAXON_ID=265551 /ORGANISM="Synedropsis recta cf, Strain CCMP1620" /LENGTH=202 /DNA_ID=CAMNT_0006965375 /DNA_START=254 /DNA_END=862 /DNA_ORIENTATION=-
MPPIKRETTKEWLARSMGFVDKVCCYSYSQEQIYSESNSSVEVDMNSINLPPSWDMDDSSMVENQPHHSIWKTSERSTRGDDFNRYPQKSSARSPGRSVSTSTTVTTSTTPTVVTSSRTVYSGDNSITSQSQRRSSDHDIPSRRFHHDSFQSERWRATPNHIYCHSRSDGEQQVHDGAEIKSVTSTSYSRVPFTSATEGFKC